MKSRSRAPSRSAAWATSEPKRSARSPPTSPKRSRKRLPCRQWRSAREPRDAAHTKHDRLFGLKENVIIGKLISAGTGMSRYRNLSIAPEGQDLDEDGRPKHPLSTPSTRPRTRAKSSGPTASTSRQNSWAPTSASASKRTRSSTKATSRSRPPPSRPSTSRRASTPRTCRTYTSYER
jgi:hypothetical protein